MNAALYVVMATVVGLLGLLSLAMLVRALLSWMVLSEDSVLGRFLFVLTEPIILPIRALCARFGWFEGLPFDMPFIIASVLLMLVISLLTGLL